MSKRFNWLNKLVLAALMVTTLVPQAQAVEVGQAPAISNVYATPNPYDPTNDSVNFGVVTMNWNLNTVANVSVQVFSANDSVNAVATPMGPTNRQPGDDKINWDGKKNGTLVAPGTYNFVVTADNLYGHQEKTGSFVIAYSTNNTTAPDVTSVSVSPNPFDPNSQSTTFSFCLDKSADVKLEILDGSTVKYTNTSTYTAGCKTKSWDGYFGSTIAPEGTYTYRLTATNPGTTTPSDVTTGSITVDYTGSNPTSAPNILNHYVTPNPFDPDQEDAKFTVTLDKQATDLKVEVRIDGNYMTVDGTRHNVSSGTFFWDGQDNSGDQVDDGTYTYRVTASNSFGTDTDTGTVTVDSNGGSNGHHDNFGDLIEDIRVDRSSFNPDDSEKAKLSFDVLRDDVKITVDILDDNDDVVDTLTTNTLYDTSNNNSLSWNGEDDNGDVVDDGTYTFRIRATKSGYDNEVAYRDVEVDTNGSNNDNDFEDDYGDLIDNVDVENALFQPKEGERAKLIFDVVDDNVDVTVDVIDRSKHIERDLVDQQYDDSNNNNVYWNGRDNSGHYSDDDLYLFRIRAEKSGHDDEIAYRWLEVDSDGIIIGFPNGNGENCAGFTDVSASNPYCKAIELMKLKGIFTGYPDGTFRIGSAINRAETVKVVVLAIGLSLSNTSAIHFWDVPNNAWYITYLATAVRYGIINGYPDGAFRGENVVNRVELLKIFLRGTGMTIPYCNVAPFKDTPVNADTRWYMDFACFAANNGLMSGDSAGNFNPAAPMTRGDVAMLFYNFYVRGMDSQINLGYYTGNNYNGSYYTPGYNYTYTAPTTSYYYY